MRRRQAQGRGALGRFGKGASSGGGRSNGNAAQNFDEHNLKKFREQLLPLRLDVANVEADGNCLFRAISDQLVGNESRAAELRKRCVDYMEAKKEDFEPFIEDDQEFDDYIAEMRRDGVWAGNLELQALSKILKVNIRVHQLDAPAFDIRNFKERDAAVMHLSYHSNEHYASVRPMDCPIDGPARHKPLPELGQQIKTDAEVVGARTGVSLKDAATMLRDCDGDIEAAVESLLASSLSRKDLDTNSVAGKSNTSATCESTSPQMSSKPPKSASRRQTRKKKERKRRRRREQELAAKVRSSKPVPDENSAAASNSTYDVRIQPTLAI